MIYDYLWRCMFLCAPYWVQTIHKMHDICYLRTAHSYQAPGQIVLQTIDANFLELGAKTTRG